MCDTKLQATNPGAAASQFSGSLAVRFGQQGYGVHDAERNVWLRAPLMICSRQPGLPVATMGACVVLICLSLRSKKFAGHLRLNQVINSGAAATPRAFRQFNQFKLGMARST